MKTIKRNIMTKKEQHTQINKAFYEFVNKNYPQYELNFEEGYGQVYLMPKEGKNHIMYHQSQHYCLGYNEDTIREENEMNLFLQNLIIGLETQNS